MLKGNRIYIFLLFVAIILIVISSYLWSERRDNWKFTYATNDKNPFGTALVYELLPQYFKKPQIERVDRPVYNFLKDKNLRQSNYIFIGNDFTLQKMDIKALLQYVADGNNVFIAANSFSTELEDTLGFYTTFSIEKNIDLFKIENTSDTYVNELVNHHFGKQRKFIFKGIEDGYQLVPIDSTAYQILAVDNAKRPVFIRTKYGDGVIYLHSFPLAFTNYYLLFKQHHTYIQNCLSYLPEQTTYWDDYYKIKHETNSSKLELIYQHIELQWAWYLLIVTSCLYLVFRIKRQQRIIPIQTPYPNSSLEFATTIGRLYYHKGDHKDIVKKQATYWLAYVRNTLNIPTTSLDDLFIKLVSEKSGVSENEVSDILHFITGINHREITSHEVKQFYILLHNFHKKTNDKKSKWKT